MKTAILMSVMILSISVLSAFDKKDYIPSTLNVVNIIYNNENNVLMKETGIKNDYILRLYQPGGKFLVIGKYTGNDRKLSSDNEKVIKRFFEVFKINNSSHEGIYVKEIEFIDSDQKKYWLPMQTGHYETFKREVKNKNVALYVIAIGAMNKNICALINVFTPINE